MTAGNPASGAARDENSRRTRVQPVFGWLAAHGEPDWPARLVALADGLDDLGDPGAPLRVWLDPERGVDPSARRLAWMLDNAHRLAPRDGGRWREYHQRVIANPHRDAARQLLARGDTSIPPRLKLEGPTHADCLIETERAVIWIEGKRNDWLAPATTWDAVRDQLARNAEAAHLVAARQGKRSLVIICHEHPLKHHEQALLDGYRNGTWSAGWPHLDEPLRRRLGAAIGTLTWARLTAAWPPLAVRLS
jgi:hypothetical protein